nr:MAG TPA: hypothetical protein [Caudoviricetes sp.]
MFSLFNLLLRRGLVYPSQYMPSLDGLVLTQLLGTVNSPKAKPAHISSSILTLIFIYIYYL